VTDRALDAYGRPVSDAIAWPGFRYCSVAVLGPNAAV